jgi:hypothetical protein
MTRMSYIGGQCVTPIDAVDYSGYCQWLKRGGTERVNPLL